MWKEQIIKFLKLDGLISDAMGYIETRVELLKIEIKEELAKGLSKLAVFVVLAFAFTLFIFFISMALAFMLGEHIGYFGGFSVVAGVYLILAIILFMNRDKISGKLEKQLLEITKEKTE